MEEINDEAIRDLYEQPCCGTYSSVDGCCTTGKRTKAMSDHFELTDKERDVARKVYKYLKDCFDENLAISNENIVDAINSDHHIVISKGYAQKMVAWIHINGYLPIVVERNGEYSCAKNERK